MAFVIITACFITSKLHFLFLGTPGAPEGEVRAQRYGFTLELHAQWTATFEEVAPDRCLEGSADVTVATVTITANLPRQGLRSPLLHLPKVMLKEQHSFSHFSLAPDNARLCWLAWPAREQPMVGSNPMPVHRRGLLTPLQADRQVFSEFTYAQNHKHSY